MDGTVAIITGAAQGIGRSITLRIAQQFDCLVLLDLQMDKLENLRAELDEQGCQVVCIQQDVQDIAGLQEQITTTGRRFGRIDVLINCAGIWQTKDLFDITESDWDRMLSVNLKSAFFATQAAAPFMRQQRSGNIINIASTAGRGGRVIAPHYAITKGALISLTQSTALTLGPYQVRVNAVCPGIMRTDMWAHIDASVAEQKGIEQGQYLKQTLEKVPLGRQGEPDEIANVVEFLLSDKASYISGQAINICGGMVMN